MRFAVALLTVALGPALAWAGSVSVDSDKSYDFSKVKTFAVKLGTSWGNPLGEKRVIGEVTEALTAKGWQVAPEGEADTVVVLHGAGEKQKTLNTFYSGMGGWGYRGFRGGMGTGTATTTASEYLVGTLVVDIFDAKTKQLVFRGTATEEISDKPEKNVKRLEKVTQKMFKDFPPGSAKK